MSRMNQPLVLINYLFCLVLYEGTSLAAENRWTHFGLRPLSMGNAYVAIADDYNSVFYNPAGLADTSNTIGEVINPHLMMAQKTLTFITDMFTLTQGSSSGTGEILQVFRAQSGQNHHFSAGITPYILLPGLGGAIGIEVMTTMVSHEEIEIELDTGPRMIIPLSAAMSFFEKKLRIGATIKGVVKAGIDESFDIRNIGAFSGEEEGGGGGNLDQLVKAGGGIGADLGLLFTPIDPMQPTLGLSLMDIGGTSFIPIESTDQGTSSTPPVRPPSLNTGFSIRPWNVAKGYFLIAVDMHSLNLPIHASHKFRFGLEWAPRRIIKLQAGMADRQLTMGAEYDVRLLKLRICTYAVDHSPIAGLIPNLVERRFAFQIKLMI